MGKTKGESTRSWEKIKKSSSGSFLHTPDNRWKISRCYPQEWSCWPFQRSGIHSPTRTLCVRRCACSLAASDTPHGNRPWLCGRWNIAFYDLDKVVKIFWICFNLIRISIFFTQANVTIIVLFVQFMPFQKHIYGEKLAPSSWNSAGRRKDGNRRSKSRKSRGPRTSGMWYFIKNIFRKIIFPSNYAIF